MINPFMAILFNQKTLTFHPIVFDIYPHVADTENFMRYKSVGHHTTGFISKDLAVASIEEFKKQQSVMDSDAIIDWDGNDTPAMVLMVHIENNKVSM